MDRENEKNCQKFTILSIFDAKHDFSPKGISNETIAEGLVFINPRCEGIKYLDYASSGRPEDNSFLEVTGEDFTSFMGSQIDTENQYEFKKNQYRVKGIRSDSIGSGPQFYQKIREFISQYSPSAINFGFVVDFDFLELVSKLGEGTGTENKFYLIENREYLSDSALKRFKSGEITKDIYGDTIIYSSFDKTDTNIYNDLFGDVVLLMFRGDSGKTFHTQIKKGAYTKNIKNPKTENCITNAANLIKQIPANNEENKFKKYANFIQKRSGDWCQAMSTLDPSRVYSPQLPLNTPIFLITHDKILLSYALQIGVNVIFEKREQAPIPNMFVIFYNPFSGNHGTGNSGCIRSI